MAEEFHGTREKTKDSRGTERKIKNIKIEGLSFEGSKFLM